MYLPSIKCCMMQILSTSLSKDRNKLSHIVLFCASFKQKLNCTWSLIWHREFTSPTRRKYWGSSKFSIYNLQDPRACLHASTPPPKPHRGDEEIGRRRRGEIFWLNETILRPLRYFVTWRPQKMISRHWRVSRVYRLRGRIINSLYVYCIPLICCSCITLAANTV